MCNGKVHVTIDANKGPLFIRVRGRYLRKWTHALCSLCTFTVLYSFNLYHTSSKKNIKEIM